MISEIIPNLCIGTIYDAIHSQVRWGLIINVNEYMSLDRHEWEDLLIQDRPMVHIPFMVYPKCYPDGPEHEYADEAKLWLITDLINTAMEKGHVPVLVHCALGCERSPLAVIYWLRYGKLNMNSFEEALDLVKEKRPEIQNRLAWFKKRDYDNSSG